MLTNKIKKAISMILPVLGFLLIVNTANAQKYTKSDMPDAVISSFAKLYPNAQVSGYDIENENGGKFYEVQCKDSDVRKDVLFNADGSVVEVEEQISISDLPQSVVNTANSKYPKGTITKAEKVTKGSDTMYELVIKNGRKKLEVLFNANGDFVKEDND